MTKKKKLCGERGLYIGVLMQTFRDWQRLMRKNAPEKAFDEIRNDFKDESNVFLRENVLPALGLTADRALRGLERIKDNKIFYKECQLHIYVEKETGEMLTFSEMCERCDELYGNHSALTRRRHFEMME